MIKAKLNIEYETKEYKTSIFEVDMNQFEKDSEDLIINDKEDLKYYITEYLCNVDYYHMLEGNVIDDNIIDDNMDELIKHFSYLIEPVESCCDGKEGNFCNECGKKLN